MQFHETVMGNKFFLRDVPRMIKAMERLAAEMERSNNLAEKSLALQEINEDNTLLKKAINFASTMDVEDNLSRTVLLSMWTTCALVNGWEVGSEPYIKALAKVWNAVIQTFDIADSSHIYADFGTFADAMQECLRRS